MTKICAEALWYNCESPFRHSVMNISVYDYIMKSIIKRTHFSKKIWNYSKLSPDDPTKETISISLITKILIRFYILFRSSLSVIILVSSFLSSQSTSKVPIVLAVVAVVVVVMVVAVVAVVIVACVAHSIMMADAIMWWVPGAGHH